MKNQYILFILILSLLFTACAASAKEEKNAGNPQEEQATYNASWVPSSLEERIDQFDTIVVAKCTGFGVYEALQQPLVYFDCIRNLKGEPDDSAFMIVSTYGIDYRKGSEYILFLEKIESVFWDNTYYSAGETIYESDQGLFANSVQDVQTLDFSTVEDKIVSYVKEHPGDGDVEVIGTYIHSDDLSEVCAGSDYVFTAEVLGISKLDDNVGDRTIYECQVVKQLKGNTGAKVNVVALKDALSTGKTYLFMVRRTGNFYVITSRVSVQPADSVDIDALLK